MTPNPFDQGSRYLAKLDPPGFLRWLEPSFEDPLVFNGWLDTRSIPFPGVPDRTCDTVAEIRDSTKRATSWAIPIEFQTRPDSQMFGRLLEFLGRLWRETHPPRSAKARFGVAAIVVNLTGLGKTSRDLILGTTGL